VVIDHAGGLHPGLQPLLGRRVIREHWDDILRLVASTEALETCGAWARPDRRDRRGYAFRRHTMFLNLGRRQFRGCRKTSTGPPITLGTMTMNFATLFSTVLPTV
jgi:hypothetical protein